MGAPKQPLPWVQTTGAAAESHLGGQPAGLLAKLLTDAGPACGSLVAVLAGCWGGLPVLAAAAGSGRGRKKGR